MLRESQTSNPSRDNPTNDLDFCEESIFSPLFEAECTKGKTYDGFDLLCNMHGWQIENETCRIYLGVLLSTQQQGRD